MSDVPNIETPPPAPRMPTAEEYSAFIKANLAIGGGRVSPIFLMMPNKTAHLETAMSKLELFAALIYASKLAADDRGGVSQTDHARGSVAAADVLLKVLKANAESPAYKDELATLAATFMQHQPNPNIILLPDGPVR